MEILTTVVNTSFPCDKTFILHCDKTFIDSLSIAINATEVLQY